MFQHIKSLINLLMENKINCYYFDFKQNVSSLYSEWIVNSCKNLFGKRKSWESNKKVSEYKQEIPQSQTADQTMAL